MSTAFTEHVRRQQELEEKKHQEDAERQLCATKAEHAVIVYAWTRDGESPCIHEFQAGFSWRYFIISHSILEALHLANLSPSVEVQLFHHGLKTWVCIDEGHVVAFHPGVRIFLKATNVVSYPNFDTHLKADVMNAPPHLRYNLAGERRELRQRSKELRGQTPEAELDGSKSNSTDELFPHHLQRTRNL